MTLRQKLACVGLTVFGLQIASAAAGGAPLADRLRLWLDPEQLLAASGTKSQCEQVRVIDKSRVKKCICTLSPQIMSYVDKALKNAFFYGGV